MILLISRIPEREAVPQNRNTAEVFGGGEAQTGPVSCSKWALINRQASLKAALAPANMMNSHCGGATANVSDKQKQQRIKASKLFTLLQLPPSLSSFFLLCSKSQKHSA